MLSYKSIAMLFRNTIQRIRPLKSRSLGNLNDWSSGTFVYQNVLKQNQYQPPILQRYTIRNANTSPQRPFKILGLQQVAIGSTDAESMNSLWVDIFGLPKVGSYTSEKENVSEDILKLGSDGQDSVSVEVDLMRPLDEERSPKVYSDVALSKLCSFLQEKACF
jgi:hypothetical protein